MFVDAGLMDSAEHPEPPGPKSKAPIRVHRANTRAIIVGLPNAGKSSLFNALTSGDAKGVVDDAVFTTLRPNHGCADFEDARFDWLCEHFEPEVASPSRIRLVDCPALVKDSWMGAGLGCDEVKTLGAAADLVYIVLRAFGGDITQIGDTVNPLRDLEIVANELFNMDTATANVELSILRGYMDKRMGGRQAVNEFKAMTNIVEYLTATKKPLRCGDWGDQDLLMLRKFRFVTTKVGFLSYQSHFLIFPARLAC